MRRSITLVAVASLALGLAACSSGGTTDAGSGPDEGATPTQEAGGELVIWSSDTQSGPLREIAERYTDDTGIEVQVVEKDLGRIRDDLVAQGPEGNGPDIVAGAHDVTGKLVQNGVVAPLELGDVADGFLPVALDAMTYDGTVYGVPFMIENVALVRNTDLAPQAPATLDEAIAVGKDLVAQGRAQFPFLIQQNEEGGDPFHLYPVQTSFGAPVFGQADDGSYDPTDLRIGDDGGRAFAEYLARLGAEGVLKPTITGDVATEAFASGQAPFMISGPWNAPAFTEAGVPFVVEPVPPAGPQPAQPFVTVQGLFVSAYAANPTAASDFVVNFMSTPESQLAMFAATGRAPALVEAAESTEVTSDPTLVAFAEYGSTGVPMPNIPEMDAVWKYWGNTQVQIQTGAPDPAGLWDQMATSIASEIG